MLEEALGPNLAGLNLAKLWASKELNKSHKISIILRLRKIRSTFKIGLLISEKPVSLLL